MKPHGSIIRFTQHGLEKYDCMTKQYFRATNHKGQDALCQIMEKQNRLHYLGDHVKRQKCYETTCSNCHKTGHKKVTCTEPCSSCNSSCYRDHLVKVNANLSTREHTITRWICNVTHQQHGIDSYYYTAFHLHNELASVYDSV